MASAARIHSLSRHSWQSLEQISFCRRTALIPVPRLAALAEQLLLALQLGNAPSWPI